jgi:hypothetical protein
MLTLRSRSRLGAAAGAVLVPALVVCEEVRALAVVEAASAGATEGPKSGEPLLPPLSAAALSGAESEPPGLAGVEGVEDNRGVRGLSGTEVSEGEC